ncbi:MAG: Abi family protein, partial [Acutalibacteraceae bacterium]|nr:Abi family protein [Acutalibacteraceae bacterium]
DKQSDYLNVNNYNYGHYQKDINVFITLVNNILDNPERYKYIKHNITTYGSVPLWVLIQSLTLGNVSKMYNFSSNKLQSQIAREFKNVYGPELSSMLNILSKFRNVCAHGERLYSYATKKEIKNLPIYSRIDNYTPTARNNLFAVYICIKYLSTDDDFNLFSSHLKNVFNILHNSIKQELASLVMQSMGFPKNWMDITDLEK